MVGLNRKAVVGLWRVDDVLLEEGRVLLQVLLRETGTDLKHTYVGDGDGDDEDDDDDDDNYNMLMKTMAMIMIIMVMMIMMNDDN